MTDITNYKLQKSYYLGIRNEIQSEEAVRSYCNMGQGWSKIIDQLLYDLDQPKMEWDCTILQVKEKWGGLRFYIGAGSDEVHKRVHQAEADSYKTCYQCGAEGKPRQTGWVSTLCDNCLETLYPNRLPETKAL